jgi:hypothetical protein
MSLSSVMSPRAAEPKSTANDDVRRGEVITVEGVDIGLPDPMCGDRPLADETMERLADPALGVSPDELVNLPAYGVPVTVTVVGTSSTHVWPGWRGIGAPDFVTNWVGWPSVDRDHVPGYSSPLRKMSAVPLAAL